MRRVVIAVGDAGYRAALAFLIDGEPDLEHVGSAPDVAGLLALLTANEVDVAAVELRLPGGGLERLRAALDGVHGRCRLVALSVLDTPSARAAASRSGAVFAEQADASALLAALRRDQD